jgi:hypothetical protein
MTGSTLLGKESETLRRDSREPAYPIFAVIQ